MFTKLFVIVSNQDLGNATDRTQRNHSADVTSDDKPETLNVNQNKSHKRKRNVNKKTLLKLNRNSGNEYFACKGKEVEKKTFSNIAWKRKIKCSDAITEEQRKRYV